MPDQAETKTFDEFFVEELPPLVAILGAWSGGRSVAEDLAQDALVVTSSTSSGGTTLTSIGVPDGSIRAIGLAGLGPSVVDAAAGRALVFEPDRVSVDGSAISVADFTTGTVTPVVIPLLEQSSMEVTGSGLSPDGTQLVLMLADRVDSTGHLLVSADIASNGTIGSLMLLAAGPEFAPNDRDRTIRPAGLGRLGEIVWTDSALLYSLGPDRIVTLPLG